MIKKILAFSISLLFCSNFVMAQVPSEFDPPSGCVINPLLNGEVRGFVNLVNGCGPATTSDAVGVKDANGFYIGSDNMITATTFSFLVAQKGADNGAGCVSPEYGFEDGVEEITLIFFDESTGEFYSGGAAATFVATKGTNGRIEGPDGDATLNDTYTFDCTVLPVTFSAFRASLRGQEVRLDWATEDERNNDRFEIQRSTDGVTFSTIGTVRGNGTSEVFNNYQFIDADPAAGRNIYRLKQIDFDGAFEYSWLVYVELSSNDLPAQISLFPNPVQDDNTNLELKGNWSNTTTAKLVDLGGRVLTIFTGLGSGNNALELPQLSGGVYQLIVTDQGKQEVIRLVIQ